MATTSKTLELWKTLVEASAPDDIFEFEDCYRCKEEDLTFELVWNKKGATDNGVTDIRMPFKFDYPTFLLIYQRLFPDTPIEEYDVAWTIGYFFERTGHKVIVFGRDHYEELAKLIYESRGFRMLREFGI